ncbi:hypothetical protein IV102_20575 [bacterium]|nr:hypothetical protein [bacterium]
MAKVGGQLGDELLAQRAAEAGAAYARAQLKDKNDWKGDKGAPAATTTVNLADLKIVEDNGNVIGWLKSASGEVAVFRIRFNYQDGGSPGPDSLADPAPTHVVDHVYVSLNNIASGSDVPVPRANPTSPWAVTAPTVGPTVAPSGGAVVEVEGLAGRAVSFMTGPGLIGAGQVTRRTLRVCYAAAAGSTVPDASISAGNGIATELTQAATVDIVGTGTARLRTKKTIQIGKPDGTANVLDMTGEAGRDTAASLTGLNATLTGSVVPKTESLGDGQDFFNLKWSDVPVASTSESAAIQLPGGVYVTGGDGKLRYYDVSPTTFKTLDQTVGCVTITSTNFSEVRSPANLAVAGLKWDNANLAVNVTGADLNIKASTNGNSDVMFTCPSGRALNGNDAAKPFVSNSVPASFFAPGVLQLTDATLSCSGNLTVTTNVKGTNGTLTSGGNATILAPSVDIAVSTTATFDNRLSVYVKNDLTLSTWQDNPGIFFPPYVNIPAYTGYGPLKLEGLVYSWGDANIFAGTPGAPAGPGMYTASNYGNVTISGALVAYGADPSTTSPGSAGNGKVNIYGETAHITYDATKLVSGATLVPGAPLQAIKRVSYGFEKQ